MKEDVWVKTTCMICFNNCAIRVHRIDEVVVKIEGNPDCPASRGVLVDKRMKTSINDIYAAGDAAKAPDFFTGEPVTNATIQSAVIQGRVTGDNMVGVKTEYEGNIPLIALNFFGNQAFSIGLTSSQNSTVKILKETDSEKKRLSKLLFDGQRLVGSIFVNDKIEPELILYFVKRRVNMPPYKDALFERTGPLSNPWLNGLKSSAVP